MLYTTSVALDALPTYVKVGSFGVSMLLLSLWSALGPAGADVTWRTRITSAISPTRLIVLLAALAVLVAGVVSFYPSILRQDSSILTEAEAKLRARRYPEARDLYNRALAVAPDDATADAIRGFVTATYYGEGLHREGLEFICSLYKGREPGDYRYVFNVQAHLRAIRRKSATPVDAEQFAVDLRDKCGRTDFSEIWASVPLGMMEWLHQGELLNNFHYRLRDEDQARLKYWYTRKSRESATGTFPFGEFILYFTGQFDEAIRKYPSSSIRSNILLEAAESVAWPHNATFFEQFVTEFPRHKSLAFAYQELTRIYAEQGDRKSALNYAKLLNDLGGSVPMYSLLYDATNATREAARNGDFALADKTLSDACVEIKSAGLSCPQDTLAELAALRLIRDKVARSTVQTCRQVAFDLRQASWTRAARTHLGQCLANLPRNTEYGKALYQLASMSRALLEYDQSIAYLDQFVRDIPQHALLDDVYTEIGWHYIFVNEDRQRSDIALRTVTLLYRDRNAYDNALWWLAESAKQHGEFDTALALYTEIAQLTTTSRFQQSGALEAQNFMQLKQFAPLSGVGFREPRGEVGTGIMAVSVTPGGEAYRLGVQPADKLLTLCGIPIGFVSALIYEASRQIGTESCEIKFRRGQIVVTFTGNGPSADNWRVYSEFVPDLPSFECNGFNVADERIVCGSPNLAAKDRELAALYAQLKNTLAGPSRDRLVTEQRAWLRRRGECTSASSPQDCIYRLYNERILQLRSPSVYR